MLEAFDVDIGKISPPSSYCWEGSRVYPNRSIYTSYVIRTVGFSLALWLFDTGAVQPQSPRFDAFPQTRPTAGEEAPNFQAFRSRKELGLMWTIVVGCLSHPTCAMD